MRTLFLAIIIVAFIVAFQSCSGDMGSEVSPQGISKDTILKTESPVNRHQNDRHPYIVDPISHQVPVLCFHHIKKGASRSELYTVSETEFAQDLKTLFDSGYHAILPQQLYQYFTSGKPLPPKSFMLSFDDTRIEHLTVAATEMDKYGFKGVFFIMTISIGKPGYMMADQIKQLLDRGHEIGCHTWDHHSVKDYQGEDWNKQIDQPKAKLESITGKPVVYFSYPFGEWDDTATNEIKRRGFKAAFQLNKKQSNKEPLFTIRRMIVPGGWSAQKLLKYMKAEFTSSNVR